MLALYQYFGYDIPLRERFALIKSSGFAAVGLWCDDWFGWTGHRAFAELARAEGLQVIDGHAPFSRDYDFVNAIWQDTQNGETTFETYMRTINECGEDGIKNLIVHIEDECSQPPNETGLLRLRRMTELAEQRGVTLALENITDYSYLSYVFERIDSPRVGFCYDAGHRNANEPDIDHLSLFGNRLVALHLHDNDGTGDQHLLPGAGNIDWTERMAAIARTGYTGPITLESTTGGPGTKSGAGDITAEQWLRDANAAATHLMELCR